MASKSFSLYFRTWCDKVFTFLLYRLSGKVAVVGLHDNLGGSFKEYCFQENMPKRVAELKQNLDAESCDVVDYCIEQMKYAPNYIKDWNNSVTLVNPKTYVTKKDQDLAAEFLRNYKKFRYRYRLPIHAHIPDVFQYHHGLVFLPQKARESMRDKDVIDGGAYIGDSALVFREYHPNKIFSFDISKENSDLFQKTMQLNHLSSDQIELISKGIGEKNETIHFDNNEGLGANLHAEGASVAQITNIDSFTSEHQTKIGLIKLDIEGYESGAVRGAVETIRHNRPILSIAIYHNPTDFFELKPYLDSLDINYRWMIRRLFPSCLLHLPWNHNLWYLSHIHSLEETYLIGYPAELDET